MDWYVFHEKDDTYALTLRSLDEREVSGQFVPGCETEDEAILEALGGRATLSREDWRTWAIPADQVKPRPFRTKAHTTYENVLGGHFV
jgi:hypothetical protein